MRTMALRMFGALAALAVAAGPAVGQVALSEVMFDPAGSEFTDEFIEVQNVGAKPVDLRGWRVGDGDETDAIVSRSGNTVLQPGAFGLILDSGYFSGSSSYDPLPGDALILTVDDATLGKGGLSNHNPERVVLLDASSDTVSAVTYRVGGPPGCSVEKVDPKGGDGPENWAVSRWAGGTPGRINSVSPKLDDLALSVATETPVLVRAGEEAAVRLTVRNQGKRTARGGRLEVEGGEGRTVDVGTLAAGDSVQVSVPVVAATPGPRAYRAVVRFEADQDTSNNRAGWTAVFGAFPQQAVINEVMFAPPEGEPEWVEILNRSGQALDLYGWQIQDERPGAAEVFQKDSRVLPSGGYAVVAEDVEGFRQCYPDSGVPVLAPAHWPRLNNGGDAVVIRDGTGSVVDSVRFDGPAPGGRSLERIDPDSSGLDPDNWLYSTDAGGATPGRENSVAVPGETDGVQLSAVPNPFRDRVEISYQLPVARADVNLWVFDRRGRQVKALLNADPGGGRRQVVWDGTGAGGESLKPGIYILYLEAVAPAGGRVFRARTAVVLARGL